MICKTPVTHSLPLQCDRFATKKKKKKKKKKWQSQRGLKGRKGFTKFAKRTPIGRRTKLVASCLLSMHKRLTDEFGRSEVSLVAWRSQRGLTLVADRCPTVRRSVSPRKGRGSSQCNGDLSVTDQRWGGDRSALYCRLVGNQLQSRFQACANLSVMGLQTSSTCLRMTASFRNK